jgi:MATE family multidrug resistance protein
VLFPDGGQVVAAQALRARGDNWFPTASHVLAYVLVMPPLALWLAEHHGQGVAGLMQAILWASVLSYGVLVARFWHLGRSERQR